LLAHVFPAMFFGRYYLIESATRQPVVYTLVDAVIAPAVKRLAPLPPPVVVNVSPKLLPIPKVEAVAQLAEVTAVPLPVVSPAPFPNVVIPKQYLAPQEVDQPAELLVPLDPSFFSDDYSLSGSVTLDVAVNSGGDIDRVEVVSAKGDDGRFQAKITDWLRDKRFNPARKAGKPVDSLFRFELNLAKVDRPFEDVRAGPVPGHLQKLDARGNPIPDALSGTLKSPTSTPSLEKPALPRS
jgi:Gram-negative bacterial TonB protein C-terminal